MTLRLLLIGALGAQLVAAPCAGASPTRQSCTQHACCAQTPRGTSDPCHKVCTARSQDQAAFATPTESTVARFPDAVSPLPATPVPLNLAGAAAAAPHDSRWMLHDPPARRYARTCTFRL